MYAKFSPDATKVAYVRQNDIYVEDIASGATTRLTRDGTDSGHQRRLRLGQRGGARSARLLRVEP